MEEGLELVRAGLPWRLSLLCQWWWHARGLSSWVLLRSAVLRCPSGATFPPRAAPGVAARDHKQRWPRCRGLGWAGLGPVPSLCVGLLSVLPGGGLITRDCFSVTLIPSDLYFLGNSSKFWSAELFPTV